MLAEIFFSVFFFVFGWLKFFERMAFQVFVIQSLKWLASRFFRGQQKELQQFFTFNFFVTTPGTHKQTACAPITGDLSNWRLDKFRLECPELTALTAYRFENCGGSSFRALVFAGIFRWTEIGESFPLFFLGKGLMMGLCTDIYISSAFFFLEKLQELVNRTWFFWECHPWQFLWSLGWKGPKQLRSEYLSHAFS